jgi:uncharacterized membrane protein
MALLQVAIIIAAIIIAIIVVISYVFWHYPHLRGDFNSYFTVLGGLAITVLIVTLVFSFYVRDLDDTRREIEEAAELRRRLHDRVDTLFINNYPDLNRLYSQLYPGTAVNVTAPTDKSTALETFAMGEILGLMEDVVRLSRSKIWDSQAWVGWLNLFRTWVTSSLLLDYWAKNKSFYSDSLNAFIDSLIRSNK